MDTWILILFDINFNPIRELPLINGRLGTSLIGTNEGYLHIPFGITIEPNNFVGLYNRPLDKVDPSELRDMDFPIYTGQVIEVEQLETTQRVVVIPIKDMLFKWYDTASEYLMNTQVGIFPTTRMTLTGMRLVDWMNFWLPAFVNQFDGVTYDIVLTNGSVDTPVTTPYTYRAKSMGSVLRDVQYVTRSTIRFDMVTNKTLRATYHKWRDLRDKVYFVTNISLEVVQDIKSIKEAYNTIIGLGAGEGAQRDYYIVRDSNGSIESMYLYDLRQDITHDDLMLETNKMFAQLQSNYSITFKLTNNQYNYLNDFRVGDTITFVSDIDNKITHVDMITGINIEISNGTVSSSSEITIGSGSINLSDKLNSALETEVA